MNRSQSNYVSQGLSGGMEIKANLLNSEYGELRIIGRNPETGIQQDGVPFSMDIEIDMYKNFWNSFLGATCPDALVVAVDPQNRNVLASTRIITSTFDGCRGAGKLVFNRNFKPDSNNPVMLELYYGDKNPANLSTDDRLGKTNVMTLDIGMEDGKNSGLYSDPTESWYDVDIGQNVSGAFSGVSSTLNKVLWIAGIGAGIYFLSPMMPGLRDSVETIVTDKEGSSDE